MPEGYSGQYSLRRNLVSLSNKGITSQMQTFSIKDKAKSPQHPICIKKTVPYHLGVEFPQNYRIGCTWLPVVLREYHHDFSGTTSQQMLFCNLSQKVGF